MPFVRSRNLFDGAGVGLVANLFELRNRHLPTVDGFVYLYELPRRDQLRARRGDVVLSLCKLLSWVVPA